ncbi:MAG: PfkB family carbohydrate kinase, partial [Phycisphaerae bacterium]|nr:PfkB family carbohydrate kinase [Phycisphaerae bacterium]
GALVPGIETQLVTKAKDDLMGRAIRHDLQRYGIGLDHVLWTDKQRNGLYFLEQGLGPISASVDYDRSASAIAASSPSEFDWAVLDGASAFFTTGITAALSDSCRQATRDSLKAARDRDIWTFVDVNYRNKLWTPEKAGEAIGAFINDGLISVLITTETDAKKVFEVDCGACDETDMPTLIERSKKVLSAFEQKFGGKCNVWLLTVRKRITNETGQWSSVALVEGKDFVVGDCFDYTILDRPGAGDACAAGVVGGFLGVTRDGVIEEARSLADRIKTGLDLGNRMSVVAQKTAGDLGPQWSAGEYFKRVSENKEISR